MVVVVSYGKYPRSIAKVFTDLYSVQPLTEIRRYFFIYLLLWLEGGKITPDD